MCVGLLYKGKTKFTCTLFFKLHILKVAGKTMNQKFSRVTNHIHCAMQKSSPVSLDGRYHFIEKEMLASTYKLLPMPGWLTCSTGTSGLSSLCGKWQKREGAERRAANLAGEGNWNDTPEGEGLICGMTARLAPTVLSFLKSAKKFLIIIRK